MIAGLLLPQISEQWKEKCLPTEFKLEHYESSDDEQAREFIDHIAAGQTNFRPLSKSSGGFQDLSYVVLLLFHSSSG